MVGAHGRGIAEKMTKKTPSHTAGYGRGKQRGGGYHGCFRGVLVAVHGGEGDGGVGGSMWWQRVAKK